MALFIGMIMAAAADGQTLPVKQAPQAPQTPQAAQAIEHGVEQSPLCDPDSTDVTFTFSNLPAGQQTISLHFQNKSNTACRLNGEVRSSFAVDGHGAEVTECWLCDQNNPRSHSPEGQPGNQILLAPGERATLDMRWTSTGESCQWADWAAFPVNWAKRSQYLFVPSEWPMRICSAVKSAGYRVEGNSSAIGDVTAARLRVSVMPETIYSDEHATLHAELVGPTPSMADPAGCASLYTVRQGRSTAPRLDALRTRDSLSRPSYTSEQMTEDQDRPWPSWKTDHVRRCDIADGETVADAYISAEDLANVTHIEWRTAAAPGDEPDFLTATTHFNVHDVDSLAPNWGDSVDGIQAGLSVDRTSFSMGDRIPLHLRWENVDASAPLGQGECKQPVPALEIQDSQHNVLQTISVYPECNGHGWGPSANPKGAAQRAFFELATPHPATPLPTIGEPLPLFSGDEAKLPGPGVYYIVSVWSPQVLDSPDAETDSGSEILRPSRLGKIYATARSLPVRVEVGPGNDR